MHSWRVTTLGICEESWLVAPNKDSQGDIVARRRSTDQSSFVRFDHGVPIGWPV